jgi:hypothetical protein
MRSAGSTRRVLYQAASAVSLSAAAAGDEGEGREEKATEDERKGRRHVCLR